MKRFQFLLVLIAFGVFTPVAGARIIHVPADSSTIQGGINGAMSGDTVLVAPGTYYQTETLRLKDSVRVQGAGIDLSVIEASPDTSRLWQGIWGAWGAQLEGFTIVGTDTTDGIFTWADSMLISKNRMTGCQNAIAVATNAVIAENIIIHNRWGGIFCGDYYDMDLGPLISKNLILNSEGAIGSVSSNLFAVNNTIDNNERGIHVQQSPDDTTAVTVTAKNNIISNNDQYGVYLASGEPYGVDTSLMTIDHNDVWNNFRNYSDNWIPDSTDISEDPLFVEPLSSLSGVQDLSQAEIADMLKTNHELNAYYTSLANGEQPGPRPPIQPRLTGSVSDTIYDYHLQENSPCIDKGDPDPIYNDPDGTRNDMGAYYFDQSDSLCIYPVHFVFTDSTEDSYSIVIDSAFLDGLELEECDEIGVFDDTGNGKGLLCVGASVYHPDSLPIPLVAWKDDPLTDVKDGYTPGDTMYFRVWSRNQDREGCALSHFKDGEDGTFEWSLFSQLWLEAPCEECAAIPLYVGWQWICTNIDPDPCEMESIFVNCWGDLDIVKAPDGDFCIPGVGCWIDCWYVCEMYSVHMTTQCTIELCGTKVNPDYQCPLDQGWNWICYFPECPLEPETALVSIWDNLDIVKNDVGEFCIPGVGCWIECMEYNEGYKVHCANADTLIYPITCPPCPPPFAKRNSFSGFARTTHFNYLGNTAESYSIVVNSVELNGKLPEVGDEIGVFTTSGLCVGGGVWQEDILGIAAWQDDDRTEVVDGFQLGDQMVFKLWDRGENKEIELTASFEKGDGRFGTDAYALVNLKGVSPRRPKKFELAQNYPNPFNPETIMQFSISEPTHVKVEILNLLGQKVATLVDGNREPGNYQVSWAGTDSQGNAVANGIYFYRLVTEERTMVRKMLLIK